MMDGFGFGGMLFGGIFMLAFWVLVVAGVIWLVVALTRNNQTSAASSSSAVKPLDSLKVRYAKGETTIDHYEEMKRDLGA